MQAASVQTFTTPLVNSWGETKKLASAAVETGRSRAGPLISFVVASEAVYWLLAATKSNRDEIP